MTDPIVDALANQGSTGWSTSVANSLTIGLTAGNQILIGQDVPPEIQSFTDVDGDAVVIVACIVYYLGATNSYRWEGIGTINGNNGYAAGMVYQGTPSTNSKLTNGLFVAVDETINHLTQINQYCPTPPISTTVHFKTQIRGQDRLEQIADDDVTGGSWVDQTVHYDRATGNPVGSYMFRKYGLIAALMSGAANIGVNIGNAATALNGGNANYQGIAVPLAGKRRYKAEAFTLVRSTVAGDLCQLDIRYGPLGTNADPVVATSGPVPLTIANDNYGVSIDGRFSIPATNATGKFTMTLVRAIGTGLLTAQSVAGQNSYMEISDCGSTSYWSDTNP